MIAIEQGRTLMSSLLKQSLEENWQVQGRKPRQNSTGRSKEEMKRLHPGRRWTPPLTNWEAWDPLFQNQSSLLIILQAIYSEVETKRKNRRKNPLLLRLLKNSQIWLQSNVHSSARMTPKICHFFRESASTLLRKKMTILSQLVMAVVLASEDSELKVFEIKLGKLKKVPKRLNKKQKKKLKIG